jgi:hypothetical protein
MVHLLEALAAMRKYGAQSDFVKINKYWRLNASRNLLRERLIFLV